jgi:repressor LexA
MKHLSDTQEFSRRLLGKRLDHIDVLGRAELRVHFEDGAGLVIRAVAGRLVIEWHDDQSRGRCPIGVWPTTRQREYVEFIAKYISRFGRPPAESDIQRHFLISAPSVNHMVQGLERKGFIERQPGVPRSIQVVMPRRCVECGGIHHLKSPGAPRSRQ